MANAKFLQLKRAVVKMKICQSKQKQLQRIQLIISVCILLIVNDYLFACDCAPINAERSFSENDTVFIAIAQNDLGSTGPSSFETNFKTVAGFKGVTQKTIKIYQVNTNCLVDFKKDKAYLVYANAEGGNFVTNQCKRTKLLSTSSIIEDLMILPLALSNQD